mgnify:CR=1 FL=1
MVQWQAPKPLQLPNAPDIAGPMVAAARVQAEAYAQMGQAIGEGIAAAGQKKAAEAKNQAATDLYALTSGDAGFTTFETTLIEEMGGDINNVYQALGGSGATPAASKG